MDTETYQMHLVAGRTYGPDSACTGKIDLKSEATAVRVAEQMSVKYCRDMEGYPCTWCGGWHVGRALTIAEIERFTSVVRGVGVMRDL